MEPRSKQGRAVMQALQELDHPTADEVFQHVRSHHPRISLGTVYRNLDAVVAAGYARAHEIDGVRRYDIHTDPHIHLHDTETGRLVDVPIPDDLQAAIDRLAAQHGIDAPDVLIELQGRLGDPE